MALQARGLKYSWRNSPLKPREYKYRYGTYQQAPTGPQQICPQQVATWPQQSMQNLGELPASASNCIDIDGDLGLKGLVVADIQVIQNKLCEAVSYNIKLCTTPNRHEALSYKWKKFYERGILHSSCLDKFPDGYIEDVFSPRELLQLFRSLCIVSELGSDEYLMPCVLAVDEILCCNPDPSTQSVPAMVVESPPARTRTPPPPPHRALSFSKEFWTEFTKLDPNPAPAPRDRAPHSAQTPQAPPPPPPPPPPPTHKPMC